MSSRDNRPAALDLPLAAQHPVDTPIYVTRPQLPPLAEFLPMLQEVWDSRHLTNGGPFHVRFEKALCEYLGVPHVCLFANATLALVTALQALKISGEVITTPYSFVATSHALLWNGITPVFVDVDSRTMNMDPACIEAAITPLTRAIMPVHCYGQPCDVESIERIAKARNLRVIYDAAHAFGVRTPQGSVLNHGDLSVLSFHATKVFNTFEGGAIVCQDLETKRRIDHLKNFGFVDEVTVVEPGINGKMSEFNAALGLLQLQHVDAALAARQRVSERYLAALATIPGLDPVLPNAAEGHNNAYFPIRVLPAYPLSRDELYERLGQAGIRTRRYFYPLISSFPMYRDLPSAMPSLLPRAELAAQQVLCLPLYPDLGPAEQQRVIDVLKWAA